MSASDKFRRLFRLDRGVRDVDSAVEDEFRFHFDMTMRELVAAGMSNEDAEREALRRFGDVEAARARVSTIARDNVQQHRRAEWRSAITQDFRYALRGMKANPGFTLGIVVTLGLGIGANATMFGIVDRLLLRPPAFLASSDRVGRIYLFRNEPPSGRQRIDRNIQYQRYLDIRENSKSFDAISPYYETRVIIGDGQEAQQLNIVMAGEEFWPMFDARPAAGRFFVRGEDAPPNGTTVAVLGYGFWQTRFGGQMSAIGQELRIGAKRYSIVGVAPRGFGGLSLLSVAAFVPLSAAAQDIGGAGWERGYNVSWLEAVARRKPGVTVDMASRELGLIYERSLLKERAADGNTTAMSFYKPYAEFGPVLYDRGPQGRSEAKVSLWLLGVTGIVLLIAVANVAGLLLARAIRRRREIAVRIALGVSRARLFTMLLVETLTLALLGAAAGLLVAEFGGRALRAALMPDIEWESVARDPRTVGVAFGIATLCGVLAGLAPIVLANRTDLNESIRGGHREGAASRSRLRTGLLLFQSALSVVGLVAAGLFVSSLRNARTMQLGYDLDHVAYVSVDTRGFDFAPGDTGAVRRQHVRDGLQLERDRLLARARTLAGVEAATITYGVPFWMTIQEDLWVPGVDSVGRLGDFILIGVGGDYFKTMGTRILRGRPILDTDRLGTARVVVVSEAMAAKIWPGQDPMGKCVKIAVDTMPCSSVVGVAEGIVRDGLQGDTKLQYYVPMDQYSRGRGGLFVRTRLAADDAMPAIRAELQKQVPVSQYVQTVTLSSIMSPMLRQWQLGATMFTLFGLLALVLAAVGLYSVISYSVAQRTHEMGIRVALGANAGDVVGMVMTEGMRLTLVGLAIGAAIAYYAAPWLQKLLFHVEPREPTIFAVVAVVLVAVAALATMIPALRAARVDPQEALRAE